jgi:hypothetical protein
MGQAQGIDDIVRVFDADHEVRLVDRVGVKRDGLGEVFRIGRFEHRAVEAGEECV